MTLDIDTIIENNVPVHLRNTNIINFIKSFVNTLITNETDINNLENAVFIDTAVGQELDDIGELFKLNRLADESDVSYRQRLKSYYQILLSSGTHYGITKAISLLLNVDESLITLTEQKEYKLQQSISDMESSDVWTGTGVSYNLNYKYFANQSIKLSGSSTIIALLTKNINLSINNGGLYDMFQIWSYIPDITKIDEIRLSFTDGSIISTGIITNYINGSQLLSILKTSCSNYTTIDWENITAVSIEVDFNAASECYFDFYTIGMYSNSNKILIDTLVTTTTGFTALTNIDNVITNSKAAGIYVTRTLTITGEITAESLSISDAYSIVTGTGGVFTAGVSVAGGFDVV